MIVRLLNHQKNFLLSKSKYALLSGGVGSGKTFIGAHYVINKTNEDRETMGLIASNTYRQLNGVSLNTLFDVADDLGIKYNYNQKTSVLNFNGAKILCVSLTKFDDIRGYEFGWGWLDETRDTKAEAFNVVQGRLRCRKAKKLECRLTSTPSGFNWMYDYFLGEKKTDNYQIIRAASLDNPYLPEGYVESLEESYDEKMARQEIYGEYLSITQGKIYYAFDRNVNVGQYKRIPNYPIWIFMDFNINPMTAVVCQIYNDIMYIVDEFYLMSSNTKELGEEIIKLYGRGHSIIPDATGKALKTSSSGKSDHQILKDLGFRVLDTKNPFRIDRYNCVNGLLEKKRILIDNKCVKLIRDLEQVSYKEGSSLPDTTNSELTHISDGLGYGAHYFFPIVKRQKVKVRAR